MAVEDDLVDKARGAVRHKVSREMLKLLVRNLLGCDVHYINNWSIHMTAHCVCL